MATTERNARPGLARDDRGAVLVIGVFMASFLVGAIWYLMGIGDALVYREFLQDGADATSFASAVYHARGMNAVAMLNVVMAAIFAVLVALHVAHAIVTIIQIAACLFAWTPAGAALCTLATATAEIIQSAINSVEPVVQQAMTGLHAASNAVATVTPLVAEVRATEAARSYQPIVEGGLMVSQTLNPIGGFGLPVEDDDPSVLLERAELNVASLVTGPLAAFGLPTGRINRALRYGIHALYRMDGGPDPREPSKRLIPAARNGNDELAVWGFVWGEQRKHTTAKGGLKVATYGRLAPRDPNEASRYGTAKSEFYYDVRGNFPAWDTYDEDVMWNMRWRARMRRFTDPAGGLLGVAGAALAGFVSDPNAFAGQGALGRAALLGRLEWLH
jgi:hypothetical protein